MTDTPGSDITGHLAMWLAARLTATGQSPADAARDLGVSEATVRSWLSGRRPDEDGGEFAHLDTPAKLGDWLRARIADSGHSVRQIAESTEGVSLSTVYNWLGGEHLPRPPVGDEPDRFDLLLSNPRLGLNLRQRLRLDEIRRRLTGTSMHVSEPETDWPARGLPADNRTFTGRGAELKRLDRLLRDYGRGEAAVIAALTGTGGIGKTALAVNWARSRAVKTTFTDGCCYLNLHGYADVPPTSPENAMAKILVQLGVELRDVQPDPDATAAVYQQTLAESRLLLVLDNAHSETQVRPLLPTGPNCLALLTSRHRLPGLAATHPGISHLELETLTEGEATTLLRNLLGRLATRNASEAAISALASACGHLPLAIHIAAAGYLTHHHSRSTSIDEYTLSLTEDRIGRLTVSRTDPDTSLAATMDHSYRHLSGDAGRAYRLLALHPGPDFSPVVAASLTALPLARARTLLVELTQANLLTETGPDRYLFHDLVRDHASRLCGDLDTDDDRRAALDRVLDHYRHVAAAACRAAYPYASRRLTRIPPSATSTPALVGGAAIEWLHTELPNLMAAATYAAEHGRPRHVVHLSAALSEYLRTQGRYADAETLHAHAIDAARLIRDTDGQMAALTSLGDVHKMQSRHESAVDLYRETLDIADATGRPMGALFALVGIASLDLWEDRMELAEARYRRALEIARNAEDPIGELRSLVGLGDLGVHQRQLPEAEEHYQRALGAARTAEDPIGELRARAGLGNVARMRGRHEQALRYYGAVLELARTLGNRNWQYEGEQGLGRAHLDSDRPETALACHRRALDLATELAQWPDQARAHDGIAHAHRALEQYPEARQHWRHAMSILDDLGTDRTEEPAADLKAIRAHLAELDGIPADPTGFAPLDR